MLRLAFDAFYLVSSFRSWRNSPDFSWRKFALSMVVTMLGVAALIGAITLVAGEASPLEGPAQLAAIFGICIVATGLLIAGLMRVNRVPEDRVALPASALPYTACRDRLRPWFLAWIAVLLAAAVAALSMSADGAVLPISAGAFLGIIGVAILTPLYLLAGQSDRAIAALRASPWVHWRHATPVWRRWLAARQTAERAQRRRTLIATVAICALVIVITLGSLLLSADFDPLSGLIAVALETATLAAVMWPVLTASDRRYRRLASGMPDIYFGPTGLLIGAEFMPWHRSGTYLIDAKLIAGAVGTELTLGFMVYNGQNNSRVERAALLPAGADADLALLKRQLTARCPKAWIDLSPA